MKLRRCLRCKNSFPADSFSFVEAEGRKRLCRKRICKNCFPDEMRHKATRGWVNYINRKYGLTPAEFNRIGEAQNWHCAICGTDKPPMRANGNYFKNAWTPWHIDHDHESKRVRALLCFNCNQLLGQSKDQISTLESAARYLINHKGTVAYCGGTFDLPHAGHVKLFRWARDRFGKLVVALNRDEFCARYKRTPILTYAERFALLSNFRSIDVLVENSGDEDSKPSILASHTTHIVNGSDWTRERLMKQMMLTEEFLKEHNIEIVIFPDSDPVHTSDIKRRICVSGGGQYEN